MKLCNFLAMLFLLGGAVFFAACEGDTGPAGPKGDKGDPGTPGAKGDKGNPGAAGTPDVPPVVGDTRCDVSNGINLPRGLRVDLHGTDDDDIICGNADPNTIKAGDGDDTVYGEGAGDSIYGEKGDDMIYGGGAGDYLRGGDGNDTLRGEGARDFIYGDAGNDELHGGDGNDVFYIQDPGDDMFDGSDGKDILSLSGPSPDIGGAIPSSVRTVAVTFDLSSGKSTQFGTDTFKNIEDVWGSDKNDKITGDDGNNVLLGSYGVDTIIGGAGDDTIDPSFPGSPSDTGAGRTEGGEGNDTLHVYGGTYDIRGTDYMENGSGANATSFSLKDTHTDITGFENLSATDFNFGPRKSAVTFTGDDNANILTGGAGSDTFVIAKADGGEDMITDFASSQNDKIQFKGFAEGSRTLAGTNGKISVGGTDVVNLGSANESEAAKIRTMATLREFVD